jgi:hypothetical protein
VNGSIGLLTGEGIVEVEEDLLKPPMHKGMADHTRVLKSRQQCAMVTSAKRMAKIAAAGMDGRYFQR